MSPRSACALKTIARVKPKVLVINGGDGTVQAALTELYHGGHFGGDPPPVAVLPNGKTNLIAHDLGAAATRSRRWSGCSIWSAPTWCRTSSRAS